MFARFSRLLDRHILKVEWIVKPKSESDSGATSRGDLIEMAKSARHLGDQKLTVSRIIKRSNEEPFGIGIYWRLVAGNYISTGLINLGEDPRIFIYRSELWVYYQEWNSIKARMDLFIFSPMNGKRYQLFGSDEMGGSSYSGFTLGKNWAPFVRADKLHFVSAFEPLRICSIDPSSIDLDLVPDGASVVVKDVKFELTNSEDWHRRSLGSSGIGAVRGGSGLEEIGPDIFGGFTHMNHGGKYEKSHQIGYVELDFNSLTLKHRELTKLKLNLLSAPYGIELKGANEIKVSFNCSVGSVSNLDKPITNKTAVFILDELRF